MKHSILILTCLVAALLPTSGSAATVTPFTATVTGGQTLSGWQVPGVDPGLMPDPSECCQWRDAVFSFTWSGDIVGTSIAVISRADNNIWGKETLTTAAGTWEIRFEGEVISGYGAVGKFVGKGTDGTIIQGTFDRNIRQGEILNPQG